jgi:hypothetical protein
MSLPKSSDPSYNAGMATTKKTKRTKKAKVQSFRVSRALVSLTYLGTMWRTAIVAALFITIAGFSLAQSQISFMELELAKQYNLPSPLADSYFYKEALIGILVTAGAFAVYDSLLVAVVRKYQLKDTIDKIVLLGSESIFIAIVLLSSASSIFLVAHDPVQSDLIGGLNVFMGILLPVVLLFAVLFVPVRFFIGVTMDVAMKRKQ